MATLETIEDQAREETRRRDAAPGTGLIVAQGRGEVGQAAAGSGLADEIHVQRRVLLNDMLLGMPSRIGAATDRLAMLQGMQARIGSTANDLEQILAGVNDVVLAAAEQPDVPEEA